jgi:hypothetical protein
LGRRRRGRRPPAAGIIRRFKSFMFFVFIMISQVLNKKASF